MHVSNYDNNSLNAIVDDAVIRETIKDYSSVLLIDWKNSDFVDMN